MKNQSVLVLLAALIAIPSAWAGEYPTQSFDATYQLTGPQGGTKVRMASDGKGHFLSQTSMNGQQFLTLVDYLNKTSTTLIEQGKIAMQTKLPASTGYVADDSTVKARGGKAIGSKNVNGHPCHGFEVATPNGKSQSWIGDDCKILVQSTSETPAGKTVMDLQKVSGAPSADAFKIPPGYKLMAR